MQDCQQPQGPNAVCSARTPEDGTQMKNPSTWKASRRLEKMMGGREKWLSSHGRDGHWFLNSFSTGKTTNVFPRAKYQLCFLWFLKLLKYTYRIEDHRQLSEIHLGLRAVALVLLKVMSVMESESLWGCWYVLLGFEFVIIDSRWKNRKVIDFGLHF